jgi:hypothetical protein
MGIAGCSFRPSLFLTLGEAVALPRLGCQSGEKGKASMPIKFFKYGMLLVLGLFVACSSLGQQYTPVKAIPEGKALIYIFFLAIKDPGEDRILLFPPQTNPS